MSSGNNAMAGGGQNTAHSAHSGQNQIFAVYSTTTVTLSTSDVINFAYVPEGAWVLDGYLAGIIKSGTGSVVKVGLGAAGAATATGASTDGDFLAGTTFSSTRVVASFRAGTFAGPYKVASIAAATYPKVYPVNGTLSSGTNTASVSLGLVLWFNTSQQI